MVPRHLMSRVPRQGPPPTRHPMTPVVEVALAAELAPTPEAPEVAEEVPAPVAEEVPASDAPEIPAAEEVPAPEEAEVVELKPTWSEAMTRSSLATVAEAVGLTAGNKSKADLVKMLRASDLVVEE